MVLVKHMHAISHHEAMYILSRNESMEGSVLTPSFY